PAFVPSRSTCPACSCACATNNSTSPSRVTSARTPTQRVPVSPVIRSAAARARASSRPHKNTRAPSRANSRAAAKPIPALPAATKATRLFKPKSIGQSLHSRVVTSRNDGRRARWAARCRAPYVALLSTGGRRHCGLVLVLLKPTAQVKNLRETVRGVAHRAVGVEAVIFIGQAHHERRHFAQFQRAIVLL